MIANISLKYLEMTSYHVWADSRAKTWLNSINTLRLGDLVLSKNELTLPLQKPLRQLEKLYPDKYNVSRIAIVRTKKDLCTEY